MSASKLALLPILLGASIALATPAQGVAQEGQQGQTTFSVVAHNRETGKVWVYVLQGGHQIPLGLVDGMGSATLSIPAPYAKTGDEIRLLADPLDSTDWYKSEPVTLSGAKRTLTLDIAAQLDHSSVSTG